MTSLLTPFLIDIDQPRCDLLQVDTKSGGVLIQSDHNSEIAGVFDPT